MAKGPAGFKFFPNDWIGGTRHLTLIARACYLELLLYQWANGFIPPDPMLRMALCGLPEETWRTVWSQIQDKFEPVELDTGETVLANPRMAIDRAEAIRGWEKNSRISTKRRQAGLKGASQRWQTDGNCHDFANGKTMANDGKPGVGSRELGVEEKGESKPIDTSFDLFWDQYPAREGRKRHQHSAMTEFAQLTTEEVLEVMVAVVRYAEECGEFAKDAHNWLRDRGWRDYLKPRRKPIDPLALIVTDGSDKP